MTRRNRSQMTLEAFEEEQQSLNDWDDEEEAARLLDELEDDIDETAHSTPRPIDEDTTAAVAPRGTLGLVRELEAAA